MRILTYCVCLMIFASCKEVSFKEPQPVGVAPLKEVPPALIGLYEVKDQKTGELSDTLIIESWGYRITDKNEKDWLGKGVLSDSLIIKFYENIYFVNFKSGDQWILRLIRKKPSGSIEFLSIDIQDDSKRKEMLKKLSRRFLLKEVKKGEDTFYQINPTPIQLMTLIKEGYFTGAELEKVIK